MTARRMTVRPAALSLSGVDGQVKARQKPKRRRAKRLHCWLDWMRSRSPRKGE